MGPMLASAITPVLGRLDPERAHRLAILGLRLGLAGRDAGVDDEALAMRALGLDFSNPIGLGAGFDKDARAVRGLSRLGFGFVETGTVTPRAQPGNAGPRVFRLAEERAVINRYGFNNRGLDAYVARLARLARRRAVPVGANVGVNKEGADPERDYPAMVGAVAPFVDYVVINVSSPNTPGLRDLQGEARLRAILGAVRSAVPDGPPLLVKVAPDLSEAGLEQVVEVAVEGGVKGLILGNTTLERSGVEGSVHAGQAGGLSGPPLFAASTAMLARAWRMAGGRLDLVGCGGVSTGAEALAKIRAGARLVQVYTAFSYAGPAVVGRIKRQLLAALRREGFASVGEAVGTG